MKHLIYAAQNGDAHAWTQLMRLFQDRAFSVALAQLGDYHQAQDAVQEAFVEAYLRIGQLHTPGAFGAWLRKIVLGKCVRVVRGGKSVPARVSFDLLADIASPLADPQAALIEQSIRQMLRQAIALLSEEERETFLLFAVGGYRYAEIAEFMNLPLALVKKRIYTARQRLRAGPELATLRPSQHFVFEQMTQRVQEKARLRKEKQMINQAGSYTVSLLGPGPENKTVIKNLYAFYRYELLMNLHYDEQITPPASVSEETWKSGAWVNQYGVINGLHSTTHDEAVHGEDAFWEWPNLQAYLIQLNGWPAGFACVASPPNATKGVDYRLQEFFVLNKARRLGVGTQAARLLFDRLPGRWELAYDKARPAAVAFWRKFLPEYTNGDFNDEMIGMGDEPDWPGYVFTKGLRPVHPIQVR